MVIRCNSGSAASESETALHQYNASEGERENAPENREDCTTQFFVVMAHLVWVQLSGGYYSDKSGGQYKCDLRSCRRVAFRSVLFPACLSRRRGGDIRMDRAQRSPTALLISSVRQNSPRFNQSFLYCVFFPDGELFTNFSSQVITSERSQMT